MLTSLWFGVLEFDCWIGSIWQFYGNSFGTILIKFFKKKYNNFYTPSNFVFGGILESPCPSVCWHIFVPLLTCLPLHGKSENLFISWTFFLKMFNCIFYKIRQVLIILRQFSFFLSYIMYTVLRRNEILTHFINLIILNSLKLKIYSYLNSSKLRVVAIIL